MNFKDLIEPGIKSLKKYGNLPIFIGFDVNNWGSCQYSSALDTFILMSELEKNIGFWGALDVMKIKFKFSNHIPFFKAKEKFIKYMKEYYSEKWRTDGERKKYNEDAKCVLNFDQMFEFCRNHSWDLWATAPYIFDLMFENNEFEFPYEDNDEFTNFEVGLKCWIMWSLMNIKEDSFKGYDT